MTRTIILEGRMGELFGKTHKLNVKSMQEAMHALDCLKGGVKRYLMECQDLGIQFTVQRGKEVKEYAKNEDLFLDNQDMLNKKFDDEAYIITPVPSGSIKKVLKLIFAIFLIWVGVTYGVAAVGEGATWVNKVATALGYLGAQLAINAVVELMMDDPDSNQDGAKSSLFNGPVNTTQPGVPVPIAYGEVEAGGAVINFAFTKTEVKSGYGYTFNSGSTTTTYDGGGNYDYGNAGGGAGAGGNDSHDTKDTYQR